MPLEMWHCPHCGAPQAETARCWVCRRSSTTCSTCIHFRRALAGDLGYCGLDARRRPLSGLEQRGCWEPKPTPAEPESPRPSLAEEPHRLRGRPSVQVHGVDHAPALRDFVPVELLAPAAQAAVQPPAEPGDTPTAIDPPTANGPPAFVIEPEPRWGERTSLFGDPEG
jgi:hypothetical protein